MKKSTWLLLFPMLLQATYWGMLKVALPILPHINTIFNIPEHFVHAMLSLSFILSGLSSIIWGTVTNGINNKRFIFNVMIVGILFMIALFFTQTFWVFFLLYVASCVLLNSFSVYSRAFPVLYLSSPDLIKRAFSFRLLGGFTAAFIAPLLSGFICHYYDWRYLFIIIIVWLVFVYFVALFIGNEEIKEKNKGHVSERKAMKMHLKNKNFLYYLIILCGGNGIAQSYVVSTPFWLENAYQIPMKDIGWYLFPLLLPGMLMPFVSTYLEKRLTERKKTTLYMSFFMVGGGLSFTFFLLETPPAWVWVIPGFFTNLGAVGLSPFITYNALASIDTFRNAGSTLLSIFSYLGGGAAIFLTLNIKIQNFYLEGIFLLIVIIMMGYFIRKTYVLQCQ